MGTGSHGRPRKAPRGGRDRARRHPEWFALFFWLGVTLSGFGLLYAWQIHTVAGGGLGDGGPAAGAILDNPTCVARDAVGNLYLADHLHHQVRKVDAATGTIGTVAGTGTAGFSGDGGPAVQADLNKPYCVAVDGGGNLYLSEWSNHVVRRVDAATGIITTVAGTGLPGFSGDGGPGIAAQLNKPAGLAVDGAGNLYIADYGNSRVRRLAPGGTLATVAGTGTAAYGGDGGPATAAQINKPRGVAVEGQLRLYIADTSNNVVRAVDLSTGVITTVAATVGQVIWPSGVSLSQGVLYIADYYNHRVRKVDGGIITTVAGTGTASGPLGDGGPAINATVSGPRGVLATADTLYVAATDQNRVRAVDLASGVITTFAGSATQFFAGDQGAAPDAHLGSPTGMAFDAAGNLYIADRNNHRIRRVDAATGIISTVAGTGETLLPGGVGNDGPALAAALQNPYDVAFDAADNLYISDLEHHQVRRVEAATGVITRFAGTGTGGFSGNSSDPPYLQSQDLQLNAPAGLAVVNLDGTEYLYIADQLNNRIRRVQISTRQMETVAGGDNLPPDGVGDGVDALLAKLNRPTGMALDAVGTLYVADNLNQRIRRVDPVTRIISTVAGGGSLYADDGYPAVNVVLQNPADVLLSADESVFYIAEVGAHRVRQVDLATGIISTVTGKKGEPGFSGDGGDPWYAHLNTPTAIALDASGTLFVADAGNDRVRTLTNANLPPRFLARGDLTLAADTTRAIQVWTAGPEPADTLTLSATGLPGFATLTDQGGGSGLLVVSPALGQEGVYSGLRLDVTDGSLNTATADLTLSVVPPPPPPGDTTPPVLSAVSPVTAEATGPGGAVVAYTAPTATDDTDPAPVVACLPASGSTFPLGTTPVTCTATDASGNSAVKTFTVTVQDTTAPTLAGVPAPLTTEATGPGGAAVAYTPPTATDLVDGTVGVACVPTSGSTFVLGDTLVTCSATDAHLNSATTSFTVTVADTTAPVLTGVPADFTVEATGPDGALAAYTAPTASDIVDGTVPVSCVPASGTLFPLGATAVVCDATDAALNPASSGFTVTVADTTPPVLSGVPAPITAEATSPGGAAVGYTPPTATDAVYGSVAVSCVPAPGATFALGATTVTCTATDPALNSAGAQFPVTVQDTTPPVLTLLGSDPATVEAGTVYSDAGAAAADLVDGDLTAAIAATVNVNTAAVGTGSVGYSVTDAHGNTGNATRTVNVVDTTAPAVALTAPLPGAALTGTVALAATASDNVAVARVDFYAGAVLLGSDPAAPYSAAWDTTLVNNGTYLLHAVAVDSQGNSANSATVTVTVNNAPPAPPVTAVASAVPLSGIVPLTVAFDGSASSATQGVIQSWEWDFGDGTAGSGTTVSHTYSAAQIYAVTLTVTTDQPASDTTSLDIEVLPNPPPVLSPIGPQSVDEGAVLAFTVSGSDPNLDPLVFSATGLPAGAAFDPLTRAFSWTPGYDQSGSHAVTFAVTDGTSTDQEVVILTVNNVNRPPVLDPIGPKSVDEGALLSFLVSGSDPDGQALFFSATGIPQGASFVAETAGSWRFSWTPTFDQSGSYDVTFSVSDGAAPPVSETVTVTVNPVNRPPVLNTVGALSMNEGATFTRTLSASDPDGDPVTFGAAGLPPFCSLAGALLTCTPGYADAGSYGPVAFSASDGALSDTEAVSLSVANTDRAPVLDPIGTRSVYEWSTLTFTVNGSDPDGDPLTFSAAALPVGAAFDPATRTFTWTPDRGQAGVYYPVFRVSDGALMDEEVVAVVVSAVTDPAATTGPARQVTASSAVVTGTAQPNGFSGNAWFEYAAPGGTWIVGLIQPVSGSGGPLEQGFPLPAADTEYRHRLCIQTVGPVVCGIERTFRTRSTVLGAEGNIDTTSVPATGRRVDGHDLAAMGRALGATLDAPNWNPLADLDGDDAVDGQDLTLLLSRFGLAQ